MQQRKKNNENAGQNLYIPASLPGSVSSGHSRL